VTATFNEAVQATSVTVGSFVLKSSSGATVTAAVAYNSSTNTATLTPSSLLANSTTYTATLSGVTDAAGHVMASAFSWSFSTGPAPAVTSCTPASGATGVGVSSPVTATFNEGVQSSTISFTLESSSGSMVAATVAYNSSNDTATLTPSAALATSTTYTATVSGAQDTAGDSMSGSTTWWFTTDATPTTGAPTIIGETPASGATGVPVSTAMYGILSLTATFNQAVQPSTINFTLTTASGSSVATTFWYSDDTDTATLSPEATLANSTTYKATVSGAENSSGVAMSSPFSWSFTTTAASVTTPSVISTSPAINATSVDVATPIAVNFNEAVLGSSISSANFTLVNGSGTAVAATIIYADTGALHTATLTPTSALANSSTYTATISGVKDANGNTMIGSYTWSFVTDSGSSNISQLPLVYQSNLQYVGGFRVPDGTFGYTDFNYAGQGLAYDSADNSLFIAGDLNQSVAQISIPSSIVNSSNLSNLSTASVLQPLVDVFPLIPNTSNLGDGTWATKGPIDLGGFMIVNGQLVGTEYVNYDTSGTTDVTHFVFNSLNLSSPEASGMDEVGGITLGGGTISPSGAAGFYDGYMAPIPANWQSALGAPDLTGNCCLNIISRTSYGPAVFGFNPSNLSSSSTDTPTPYVYYTGSNPLGGWDLTNPLFNGNTSITGVFFVPNTRSVLFFGSVGTNSYGYGEASTFNDPYRTGKGNHSQNGDYAYQVWAYDANDFLAVADGKEQPWQLQPYAVWNLDFPQFDGWKGLGGVAFDPSTNQLFVTESGGDTQVAYSCLPVVQVYQLTLSQAAPAVQTSGVTLQVPTGLPSVALGNTSNTTNAVSTIAAPAVSSADSSPQTSLAGPVSQATTGSTTSRKRLNATLPPPSGTVSLLQLGSRGSIWTRYAKRKGLTNFKSPGSLMEP